MKKLSIATLFLAVLAAGFSAQPARAQIQVNISIGGFYDELEPYGRWVDCSYGDCWVPARVSRGWQPYSNGEWVYTEYGWTWVSSDPWGDTPYHYGTWVYTHRYGWAWVPGTVWAPAWVTWSYSNNYVGWAPLPPSIAFGSSGYSGRAIRMQPSQYVFVPTNRFVGSNVSSVRISSQRSASIFSQTTPVTRFGVSGGIVRNMALPFETIQRATGAQIQTRNIRDARTAPRPVTEWMRGDRRQMSIVAPARDVRAAIASRPQGGNRTGGSPGSTAGNQRVIGNPAIQQQPAAPRGEMRPGGRVYQPAPAAAPAPVKPAPEAYRGKPATSNAPGNRGRGRRPDQVQPQAAPQQAAPPAAQANPGDQRGRGRGRPSGAGPQAGPPPQQAPAPAVQANPGGQAQEQHGRGRAKPEKVDKGAKDKKEKDKEKP
jgi:hypothetical protein